ncbi:hypothetical protein GBF38_001514 [Nibea albiflora]|uniref:Uncharacterized protein n=1 Tax=Nibea albiflora TaxID=240163 RepID=A0ACB7EU93_NIBAL|nr:hypothetical protein GBF38_001514 [Nibea albiflora]
MWHHLIRRVFATFHAGTRAPPTTTTLPSPTRSSPLPNHLRHTNTTSCPSAARAHDDASFVTSAPRSPTPDDNEGATRIRDITNPQAKGAKQLAPTEEDLSHVSRDSDRRGLMVILTGARRETQTLPGLFEKLIDSQVPLSSLFASPFISPSKMAVNSCGYSSLSYTPPSRVAPAGQE